ncbi:unnamed protein product [Polarella glacialis]|uniref:Uncharacterized protein n=1 Tax=Polarella glacialis TaxID=89957 RepID=A0A813K0N8_POLGL|nr:unnamed protein product [Polarella glacialis]
MSAEIAALEGTAQEGVPGISQKELDSLAAAEEGGALRIIIKPKAFTSYCSIVDCYRNN